MKRVLFSITILTLICLSGCKDDKNDKDDDKTPSFELGEKMWEISESGKLSYYPRYQHWGIIPNGILNDPVIYLLLNPSDFLNEKDIEKVFDVEFEGTLFKCKQEVMIYPEFIDFIKLETLNYN